LAKFETFELKPLTAEQAKDFVQDIAREGQLQHRQEITDQEAQTLIGTVGWRAAYYLDALAQKLEGPPATEAEPARLAVEAAVKRLVKLSESSKFGTWEEHLNKHYLDADRGIAFSALTMLARDPQGADIDGLLSTIQRADLSRERLRKVLMRLDVEGFIAVDSWELDSPRCHFLNPLLRLWWCLAKPTQ
jgi:polyhydroxyalkanoate synthesis regulator phasin